MKKLFFTMVFTGFILTMNSCKTCCTPKGLINVDQASNLESNYLSKQQQILNGSTEYSEDTREFWWSIDELESYICYAKEQATKQGKKVNGFLSLLKNPTYMGKIFIKPYKKEQEMLVEGLHPALVDSETYEKVQLILKGKYKPPTKTLTEIDTELPLRGFLICSTCKKTLTGSGSKGRDGKNTYFYYHCTRYCNERHKAKEVNGLFEKMLETLKIDEDCEAVYKSLLEQRFEDNHTNKQTMITSLQREQENLHKRLETAEDHLFEKQIDVSTFNTMKQRIDMRLMEIKSELKSIQKHDRFFEKHLKEGISFLGGVDTVYKTGATDIKRKIIKTIFCDKLTFHDHYFATPKIEDTIAMILFRNKRVRELRVDMELRVSQ